jgi:N-acylglucosamine 2-epimerase
MSYSKQDLIELKNFYANQLLKDTIPFWFPHSFDKEYAAIYSCVMQMAL